jgi:cytidylate kinase
VDESPHGRGSAAVVTIASLYGAGGNVVGPRVAERLGVRFLDRAIPSSVARRVGLAEEAVAGLDETPRGGWERLLDVLGRASPPTAASGEVEQLDLEERRLLSEIEDFLADATRSGGVVLGRGGAVVLGSVPCALHVYLGGDRKARIERVMEVEEVDRETAARRVKVNDRARREYVKGAYGVDGDNPGLYHLVIDAVSLGDDVCVELIVAAALRRARREATGRSEVTNDAEATRHPDARA